MKFPFSLTSSSLLRHLLFLLCTLTCTPLLAQGVGEWEYHLAYHKCEQALCVGSQVYARMGHNLMVYDADDGSVRCFDRRDGFSSNALASIAYSKEEGCLVLFYENKDIDLFYPATEEILNIPQIRTFVESEVVPNSFNVTGSWGLVGTQNGLVLVDLQTAEVKGFYQIGHQVNAAAVYDDVIYCATNEGLYACNLHGNPFDASQWNRVFPHAYNEMEPWAGGILATCSSGEAAGVNFLKHTEGTHTLERAHITGNGYTKIATNEKEALVIVSDYVLQLKASDPTHVYMETRADTSYQSIVPAPQNGTYWAAGQYLGLVPLAQNAQSHRFEACGSAIGGYGPRRDLCYNMRIVGKRLLVAGSRFDYTDHSHFEATALYYDDGKWYALQEEGIPDLPPRGVYRDVNDLIQDPADPTHHFTSTGGTGLYEFRNQKYVRRHHHENSTLHDIMGSGRYTRVGSLAFDDERRLWMTNYLVDTVVHVMEPSGRWHGLYYPELKGAVFIEHAFFHHGRLWLTMPELTNQFASGLTCIDLRGTPLNERDDELLLRTAATNEDGGTFSFNYTNCAVLDRQGALWVGTNEGVCYLEDPDEWFSKSFFVVQPKVPRNDGTNYADYLLNNVPVSSIAVDGANQKWLATKTSGLYLVSANGQEVLQHFTSENSPLLSDAINSLALDNESGLLWIGTAEGLCAYRTSATEGLPELQKDQIVVAPNPVRPEYEGLVSISGLTEGAEVKIMSAAGQLVRRGIATGGRYAWDRCDAFGRRVATGVYYLLITTAEGTKSANAKIVVI